MKGGEDSGTGSRVEPGAQRGDTGIGDGCPFSTVSGSKDVVRFAYREGKRNAAFERSKTPLRDVVPFTRGMGGLHLREYQQDVARAVLRSILQVGLSFVVMFPRQSGKNELQAQIEAFLLAMYRDFEVEMVKVSPTWKPQSLNAMRRCGEGVEPQPAHARETGKKNRAYLSCGQCAHLFSVRFAGKPISWGQQPTCCASG